MSAITAFQQIVFDIIIMVYASHFGIISIFDKRIQHIACHSSKSYIEHIGRLARMSVLDTEVDGSNPGSSMLFP